MTAPERSLDVLVHEVRSPVAALVAVAQAFPEADPASRKQLVHLSLDACATLERLVMDIATASVRASVVDLGALVRGAALARSVAGVNVEVDVATALPSVRGDAVRLRQALDNLLANALVHAAGSGAVVVTARSMPTTVRVSVADRGPGIPPGDVDRIFEPGVRLDESRRGAGLGLAITKAIVEAHGGSLAVASTPGRGTTFTLTLPRDDGSHPDT